MWYKFTFAVWRKRESYNLSNLSNISKITASDLRILIISTATDTTNGG